MDPEKTVTPDEDSHESDPEPSLIHTQPKVGEGEEEIGWENTPEEQE